ncbi:uncharacterized protein F5Z01DRAFT_660982 [Emericellopsis atlantica]|uniref:Zn(2)-C6 fungal-type domain-containing protein n=1 Tax=Emericellopsis atlantica TaxID=2614577 RepID=A0A9P7ZI09_9HYPO|nr:uncharacterized protein F5Z01DRAFT_660982 [Emericellopsis atlantica]KAG9252157.1 hypothetical protein F5Z01DRAFT_660982 [Emericellopsis atlantica]
MSLNRLSCVRCKDRKVRCNRIEPQCDRCKAQDVECTYPVRQKRRVNRSAGDQESLANGALSTILERLQRVEQQCVALPADSQQGSPAEAVPDVPSHRPLAEQPATTVSRPSALPASVALHSQSAKSSPALSTTPYGPTPRSPWRPQTTAAATPAISSNSVHATAILKDAMEQVERHRLQTYSASMITSEIDIPPDLARTWIRRYFAQKPTDMFLSLIDRKLVEMIPEMLNFPHVHIDSCVLVIYYSVLFHGCSIFAGTETAHANKHWAKLTYVACLRAMPIWQRESTGSMTDMIASITLGRVCVEWFDYELAWNMFKQAGEYATKLGIHNLDSNGAVMRGIQNPDNADDDRKAFWDLLQVDLFFRLMFNKPPSISGNPWNVNLPWLNETIPNQGAERATIFLASSRVTLLLMQFFAMLEEAAGNPSLMMRRTEAMCLEIRALHDEWDLGRLARESGRNITDTMAVADIALNFFTCIIFMLRKMATLDTSSPQPILTDADVPDSPIALDAARNIVDIVGWLLAKYPNSSTLAVTFGVYRAYISFAYLVSHILRTGNVGPYEADMGSLNRVSQCVSDIAACERDFIPLATALQGLNEELRKKTGDR